MTESIIVTQIVNDVVVATPAPQGPRGKTILNGNGAPANNLGLEGDFYYDKSTSRFYGPKLSDATWSGAANFLLNAEVTWFEFTWEISQLIGPVGGIYSLDIVHNLGFKPNVTVKSSAGDVLETGIVYNSNESLTLTMAQPFAGTAYLS